MPQAPALQLVANPKALKRLEDLLRMRITGSGDIIVRESEGQIMISQRRQRPPASGGGIAVAMFRYKSQGGNGDFVVCRAWDGETDGDEDVKIAKPPLLRRTPFDGATYNSVAYTYSSATTRTAVSGATTETQKVTQDYVVNDVLFAVPASTGVVDPSADDEPVRWLDINADARAWAKEGS